jgi:transcriptional regulator with XRE-family HTH domain
MTASSTLTAVQIRMARNALRWSVRELAERSAVSTSTINRAETDEGTASITRANLAALRGTLEAAGIEFIGSPDDAPGIRIHRR